MILYKKPIKAQLGLKHETDNTAYNQTYNHNIGQPIVNPNMWTGSTQANSQQLNPVTDTDLEQKRIRQQNKDMTSHNTAERVLKSPQMAIDALWNMDPKLLYDAQHQQEWLDNTTIGDVANTASEILGTEIAGGALSKYGPEAYNYLKSGAAETYNGLKSGASKLKPSNLRSAIKSEVADIKAIPNKRDIERGVDNVAFPIRDSQTRPIKTSDVIDEEVLSSIPQEEVVSTIDKWVNNKPYDAAKANDIFLNIEKGSKIPDIKIPYYYTVKKTPGYNKGFSEWAKDLKIINPKETQYIRDYYSHPNTAKRMANMGYSDEYINNLQNIDLYYHPDISKNSSNTIGMTFKNKIPFMNSNVGTKANGLQNRLPRAHEVGHVSYGGKPELDRYRFGVDANQVFDLPQMAKTRSLRDNRSAASEVFAELSGLKTTAGPTRLPVGQEIDWLLNTNGYKIGEFIRPEVLEQGREAVHNRIYNLLNKHIPIAAGAGLLTPALLNTDKTPQ